MPTRVAVIYYSATGNVHEIADAIAEGAGEEGADVRVRRVAEIAPEAVIRENEDWHAHHQATKDTVDEATLDDLEWADGIAFGTPTRFGNPATDERLYAAGGNPYGTSFVAGQDGADPSDDVLTAGRIQGRRLARVATALANARASA
jgi:multimeric flavodoxin WrbA